MGSSRSKPKRQTIIMMGMDEGLSYLLYMMQMHEHQAGNKEYNTSIMEPYNRNEPEIWNFSSKNLSIKMWRKDTRSKFHSELWKKYCKDVDGLFLVTSSSAPDKNLFHQTLWHLGPKYRHIPIMLLCDKQNYPLALSFEEIQQRIGFYRDLLYDDNELMDIRQDSLMKSLPREVFDMIIQYAKETCNGISVKWNAAILMEGEIELIEKYNDKDKFKDILEVICEYLPVYNYNDKSDKQYLIRAGDLNISEGIFEAMDDLYNVMNNV